MPPPSWRYMEKSLPVPPWVEWVCHEAKREAEQPLMDSHCWIQWAHLFHDVLSHGVCQGCHHYRDEQSILHALVSSWSSWGCIFSWHATKALVIGISGGQANQYPSRMVHFFEELLWKFNASSSLHQPAITKLQWPIPQAMPTWRRIRLQLPNTIFSRMVELSQWIHFNLF